MHHCNPTLQSQGYLIIMWRLRLTGKVWFHGKINLKRTPYVKTLFTNISKLHASGHVIRLVDGMKNSLKFTLLTFPSIPTPASAAWIMLTSFPPSPKIRQDKQIVEVRNEEKTYLYTGLPKMPESFLMMFEEEIYTTGNLNEQNSKESREAAN